MNDLLYSIGHVLGCAKDAAEAETFVVRLNRNFKWTRSQAEIIVGGMMGSAEFSPADRFAVKMILLNRASAPSEVQL